MSEQNKALLTQKEIDTLVNFLTQQEPKINGEVLNQGSIDKLVHLLKTVDNSKFEFDINEKISLSNIDQSVLGEMLSNCEELDDSLKTISYRVNESNGYIEIFFTNSNTGDVVNLVPENLTKATLKPQENATPWGCFISPIVFDSIATIFHFKYSKKTLDDVCELYAEKCFGDKAAKIADLFLPSSNSVFNNLIVD